MKHSYLILCLLACLLSGCAKTLYVPVESVRTEYRDVHTRDSIYRYDSTYVKEKGDTLIIERYQRIYVDRYLRDSVIVRDSVAVPYPVAGETVYVYKTHWYEKGLIWIGVIALLCLIGWLVWKRFG